MFRFEHRELNDVVRKVWSLEFVSLCPLVYWESDPGPDIVATLLFMNQTSGCLSISISARPSTPLERATSPVRAKQALTNGDGQ